MDFASLRAMKGDDAEVERHDEHRTPTSDGRYRESWHFSEVTTKLGPQNNRRVAIERQKDISRRYIVSLRHF